MSEFDFGKGLVPAHRHANGGGWVADTARVDESAYVGERARVSDQAWVLGKAQVCESMHITYSNDYLVFGPVGSRNAMLTFGMGKDAEIYVATGCFSGTVEEFVEAVRKTHGDNVHAHDYLAAVEMFRAMRVRRLAAV